ncbi:MAG: glycosyltransferase family 39 protein [Candidatus Korobacteraceae bacterium]
MPAAREPALATPSTQRSDVSPGAKQANLILLLLTLAGAWLRLSHLGSKSLWLDEGATVALARASWQHFAWVWWHGEANLQTIYFLLMRGWTHFGLSEAWLRLPSALFGIASIPLIFVVARKFMGWALALAAAALLSFSPTHVAYSQEARSYTLAILLVLLSSYLFERAVELGRRSDWALWTVTGILAFYSHDFAALVLVAQAGSLLFKAKPAPWKPLLICGAVIFAAALPGLTYVFRASPENLNFVWMARPSPRELWRLAMFFGGGGVKMVVALILWIAGIIAIFRNCRRGGDDFWRGMLVLLWACLPVLIIALISLRHPLFIQRYMIFSLPATILLAAMGMDALRKWHAGLILVVALCAMSIPTIVADYSKPREDWRGASNAILSNASRGDAVVFFPFYTRVMLDYYRDRYPGNAPAMHVFAPPYYDAGDDVYTLMKRLDANPQQFPHVWIVTYGSDARMENFDYGAAEDEKLHTLFGAPEVRKFTGIHVLKFGR